MINHFITVLYNRVEPNPDGVYIPLDQPLPESDVIANSLAGLRGNTPESAWAFAVAATKVVDASTYQSELTTFDTRVTYDLWQLQTPGWNATTFIEQIRNMPLAALNEAIRGREDLQTTYRRVDITQESTAAIIVGLVEKMTEYAGVG